MEDTRITFETAKLAKEKGFPQEPNRLKIPYYNYKGEFKGDVKDWLRKYLRKEDTSDVESVSAPTQSLLAKWLREKYDIEINITRMPPEAIKSSFNKGNKRIKKYNMWVWNLNGNPRIENSSLFFDNYEEALEIGLQEALKLINNK